MMRGMFAAISGLRVHQAMLDVTANNIANVNTVGFKGERVSFKDSLSQTLRNGGAPTAASGGTSAQQIGLGVQLGTIDNVPVRDEVLLFQRSTRTLVITDLCFNVHRADNALAKLFFRADGMWRRFGPSYAIRWLGVSDRAAFRRSLERVLAWDVERILPSHGEPIERGGRAALRAAWGL